MQSRRLSPLQPLKNQQHHPSLIIYMAKPVGASGLIFQELHPSLITLHASLIMPKKFTSCRLAQALLQTGETVADVSGNLLADVLREHHGWQMRVSEQCSSAWLAGGGRD